MTFDVESRIAAWRRTFAGLRAEDIDELESHLRDELDALAEVGIDGEEAFAHATKKLGASAELVEQIERAAPSVAWRAPAIAVLTGFLVNILASAILRLVDWVAVGVGVASRANLTLAYVGIPIVVVLCPLLAIAGGFVLAPRIVARVERASPLPKIAVVIGMGLFVVFANLPWMAIAHPSRTVVNVWAGWFGLTYEARQLTGYALPIVLSGALFLTRRRQARFAFWAVLGYVLKAFGGQLSVVIATVSAMLASHLGANVERAATTASTFLPLVALAGAVAFASKRTPTSFMAVAERAGVVLAFGAVGLSLAETSLYEELAVMRPAIEGLMWTHFGVGILANLATAPIAAAGLLRLRSD
jgi:hypothetical protein